MSNRTKKVSTYHSKCSTPRTCPPINSCTGKLTYYGHDNNRKLGDTVTVTAGDSESHISSMSKICCCGRFHFWGEGVHTNIDGDDGSAYVEISPNNIICATGCDPPPGEESNGLGKILVCTDTGNAFFSSECTDGEWIQLGVSGDGLRGPMGFQGSTGIQGIKGVTGPQGVPGPLGVTGIFDNFTINDTLTVGETGTNDGHLIVNGKLTVTGLMDPAGLILDCQTSTPAPPSMLQGCGMLWVNNENPSELIYTNSLGDDKNLSHPGQIGFDVSYVSQGDGWASNTQHPFTVNSSNGFTKVGNKMQCDVPGTYMLVAQLKFATSSTTQEQSTVIINSTSGVLIQNSIGWSATEQVSISATTFSTLSAGEEVYAVPTFSGGLSVSFDSSSFFKAIKLF